MGVVLFCLIGMVGVVMMMEMIVSTSLSEELETSSRSSRHASMAAQLAWVELKKR